MTRWTGGGAGAVEAVPPRDPLGWPEAGGDLDRVKTTYDRSGDPAGKQNVVSDVLCGRAGGNAKFDVRCKMSDVARGGEGVA